MDGYGVQLALVAVLVAANAVFAGSEIALISLRESQLRALARHSRGGRVLARLARDPNRFLATICCRPPLPGPPAQRCRCQAGGAGCGR